MRVYKLDMAEVQRQREQRALKSLEEGKVSFLKAAQMAGLSAWDFADLVHEKGIVWIESEKFISRDIHELRPEYVKKLQEIEKKGKFLSFKNVDELRKFIEASEHDIDGD